MTTPTLSGHAQHQFVAKVLDIVDYWAAWTGGESSIAVTEMYDGGAEDPDLIASRGTHSNVVLRRPFKPGRDMRVQGTLRDAIKSGYIKTLILQPVDSNGKATDEKIVLPGCVLVRVGTPQYDADSESGSSYELEFRPPKSAVYAAGTTKYT